MRVGLNATCFNDRPSGANQRFRGLYGALIRANPQIRFLIYEPRDARIAAWFGDCANVEAVATPLPSEGRWRRIAASRGFWRSRLAQDRLDLFETFHLPAVIAPHCPTLLTIHDLRPLRRDAPWPQRLAAQAAFRHAVRRVACTVTVSRTIAADMQALFPGASVATIANGVDAACFVPPDAGAVAASLAALDLPRDFVLTVGHLEARKNLPLLVAAIAELRRRGLRRPLLLVGNDGGDEAALRRMIARRDLGDLVAIRGGVQDDQLRSLYAAARLLAFPSRYEGFGIPLIEAMIAGKPVVASDIPVFHEVAGDAARYFPPDSPEAAADAIEAVWSRPDLAARLVASGRDIAARHDFGALAGELAALYRRILARPARAAPGE